MTYEYFGTLEEGSPSYVKREADNELYAELKAGQFCYVFNASKAGKSSLQVQVQSSLKKEGFACSTIDIQGIGTNLSLEEWYTTILEKIAKDLNLKNDLSNWKKENKENNGLSPLYRFRDFIESVMLIKIPRNIIIFIDEINHIHKLKFSTDEFFGFIRFCYNERAYNPIYKRLVFCLLGIASPSDLVKDKQITPFNIIKAISLEPFVLNDDVKPLQRGLKGKFDDTEAVMKQILYWTGGQPFLTQKLCKLMVENSEKAHPHSVEEVVEEVVREKIIKKWISHDNPAHLQTIRDRIIESKQASDLLELYRKILRLKEVHSKDTSEVSELVLSGIVIKIDGKLKVYNRIYQEIFNQKWIENQLNNLRPYSENYHAWLAFAKQDKSRLLRGNALQEALAWASVRSWSLSSEEKEYLEDSQEQERQEKQAEKDRAADLERERKNREAAERRTKVLSEANKKAKQRIRRGTIALVISLLFAVIFGILSVSSGKQVVETRNYLKTVEELTELAAEVQAEVSYPEAEELFSLAGRSVNIKDKNLQLAILNIGIANANLKLKGKDWTTKVENFLKKVNITSDDFLESSQLQILFYRVQGNLQKEKPKNPEAIKFYKKAYALFKDLKSKTSSNISPPFNEQIPIEKKILSKEVVEALHRELIDLLSKENNENSLKQEVEDSLKEHYYNELTNLLKNQQWKQADEKTTDMILYILRRDREQGLDEESINKFPCDDLTRINNLWVQHSQGKFGFSKQKEIYIKNGNRLVIEIEEWEKKYFKNIEHFPKAVGWDNKNTAKDNSGSTTGKRGRESGNPQGEEKKKEGYYPYDLGSVILWTDREKSSYYPYYPYRLPLLLFFSRAEACKV